MKKKSTRRIVAGAVLSSLLVTGLWTGNSMDAQANPLESLDKTQIKGKITVYTHKSADEMSKYSQGFEEKYPGTSVEYVYLKDYNTEMTAQMATGDYGDVILIPNSVAYDEFDEKLLKLGSTSDFADTYDYLSESVHGGDDIYGLPSFMYLPGFIYNKRIFANAGITKTPTSPEEFLEDLEQIKNSTDAIPFYTNKEQTWALGDWEVFPYIETTGNADYQFGDFPWIEEPFGSQTSHGIVYNLLYNIVRNNLSENVPLDWDSARTMIHKGEIATLCNGSWALPQFEQAEGNDDLDFFPFPYKIDGKQYVTLRADYNYGIPKNSKNPETAKAYIRYMLEDSTYTADN